MAIELNISCTYRFDLKLRDGFQLLFALISFFKIFAFSLSKFFFLSMSALRVLLTQNKNITTLTKNGGFIEKTNCTTVRN